MLAVGLDGSGNGTAAFKSRFVAVPMPNPTRRAIPLALLVLVVAASADAARRDPTIRTSFVRRAEGCCWRLLDFAIAVAFGGGTTILVKRRRAPAG